MNIYLIYFVCALLRVADPGVEIDRIRIRPSRRIQIRIRPTTDTAEKPGPKAKLGCECDQTPGSWSATMALRLSKLLIVDLYYDVPSLVWQLKSGLSSAVQSLHRLAPGSEGDGSFNNLISQKIVIIGKN